MAITDATVTKLKELHGEKYLQGVTNRSSNTKPTSIDEDVLETAVEAAEAWFARRGYSLTRSDIEVLGYVDLWARPRNLWSKAERNRWGEMHDLYPPVLGTTASTSAIAPGGENDRRHFTDDDLNELDQIRSRNTSPRPGGDL